MKRTIKFVALSIAISQLVTLSSLSMKKQEQERLDQESTSLENSDSEDTQSPVLEFTTPINSDTLNLSNEEFTREDILMDNSGENNQPVHNPDTPEEKDEEGQSILSFNFIFYILQKYKFSDLLIPSY